MAGTLRGALAARGIRLNKDTMQTEVEGLIEKMDSGGIRITTIRVHYRLAIPDEQRAEAERAVAVHDRACPATQSVSPSIKVEWDTEYVDR
ncbi:MAG TPA: OsmC family protein [Dehalococcoidia bacterium]|nr:OsmC family protein [Dehalococcoidia bacterium]